MWWSLKETRYSDSESYVGFIFSSCIADESPGTHSVGID